MKLPLLRSFALAAVSLCLTASLALAQDATPVVVTTPLPDLTIPAGTASTVIKLNKTFGLNGVSGKFVRFSTTVGNIDVALLSDSAPRTVAAFLTYANTAGDNNSGVPSYKNTLIQRAVPGFIVQGGGFYIDGSSQFDQITGRPMIPSEAGVKNTRGTLAMALSNGPDSGTGDFFFNVADNAMLDDTSDGGPFTVFGRVVAGLPVLDAIEALPQSDSHTTLGPSFANIPLFNYDGSSSPTLANLVYLNTVTPVPLTAKGTDPTAILKLKVKSNSNPGLVTATLVGRKLTLAYTAGQTGSATLSVLAKNPSTKTKALATFTVTVQ